jgi:hypothetical protein
MLVPKSSLKKKICSYYVLLIIIMSGFVQLSGNLCYLFFRRGETALDVWSHQHTHDFVFRVLRFTYAYAQRQVYYDFHEPCFLPLFFIVRSEEAQFLLALCVLSLATLSYCGLRLSFRHEFFLALHVSTLQTLPSVPPAIWQSLLAVYWIVWAILRTLRVLSWVFHSPVSHVPPMSSILRLFSQHTLRLFVPRLLQSMPEQQLAATTVQHCFLLPTESYHQYWSIY